MSGRTAQRGYCIVCKRGPFRINKGGSLRAHAHPTEPLMNCRGSRLMLSERAEP